MKVKLKLNQEVTLISNGSKCIVWGIHPNGNEVVLFNLGSRNYITVKLDQIRVN